MFRIGMMIRSAYTKAMTPPKLIPPFQRTAAKGTLPTEQTNDTTDTSGPTKGPQIFETPGCEDKKSPFQAELEIHVAATPASSSPRAISFQTEAQSITK